MFEHFVGHVVAGPVWRLSDDLLYLVLGSDQDLGAWINISDTLLVESFLMAALIALPWSFSDDFILPSCGFDSCSPVWILTHTFCAAYLTCRQGSVPFPSPSMDSSKGAPDPFFPVNWGQELICKWCLNSLEVEFLFMFILEPLVLIWGSRVKHSLGGSFQKLSPVCGRRW